LVAQSNYLPRIDGLCSAIGTESRLNDRSSAFLLYYPEDFKRVCSEFGTKNAEEGSGDQPARPSGSVPEERNRRLFQ
jgi:hypothetical protein